MTRGTQLILHEFAGLRGEFAGLREELRTELRAVSARIDSLHGRIDTVIDSLADLRSDFDRHNHEA